MHTYILVGSTKPPAPLPTLLSPPKLNHNSTHLPPLRLSHRPPAAAAVNNGTKLLEGAVASPTIGSYSDRDPLGDAELRLASTRLVSSYAKSGRLHDALKVFEEMPERDLFAWTAIINGCAREERWIDVLDLFHRMMREGVSPPDRLLLPRLLQACANSGDSTTGKALHSIAVRTGALADPTWSYTTNSLLSMYAKCGDLTPARLLFDSIAKKDPVPWNSMISGYCHHGKTTEAMDLFDKMQSFGIEPNLITWNTLISFLNRSGEPDRAMDLMKRMAEQPGRLLSPDVYTWTAMISGLAHNNRTIQALGLLREMLLVDVEPNGMTLACTLSACASLKALDRGKEIHTLSFKLGCYNATLVGNALVDFYAKCGLVDDAESVFRSMPERDVCTWNSMIGCYMQCGYCGKAHELFSKMEEQCSGGVKRNVVTWNVMISGYIQSGEEERAMDMFRRMEGEEGIGRSTASWNLLISGFLNNGNREGALRVFRQMQFCCKKDPNSITILGILPACTNLFGARFAKEIHGCVLKRGLHLGISISNSLVETYSKSGDIRSARTIFDGLPYRDIITWNSLVSGYLLHGQPDVALDLFQRMERSGEVKPNHATFASRIRAYGMLGLVEEARKLFLSMEVCYGISPGQEHYAALVDSFGRLGRLDEAMDLIRAMPVRPDWATWSTLLTASRIYGNRSMACQAAAELVEMEPSNSIARYLLLQARALCNPIYAGKLQMGQGADESLGCSWLAHLDRVFTFCTGDRSFTNSKLVYEKLDALEGEIRTAQAVTFPSRYLEVEDESSKTATGMHSEKLAIAFALVNLPVHGSIRIVKNLRICLESHTFAKYISSAYKCEILLKDPRCLHHFKDGVCSCGDYW